MAAQNQNTRVSRCLRWCFGVLLCVQIPAGLAQTGLTLDKLFARPGITGTTPSAPQWSPDSQHFAFSWRDASQQQRSLWLAEADGESARPLGHDADLGAVQAFTWRDSKTLLLLGNQYLWSVDINAGNARQIAQVAPGASNLTVAPNGRSAAYLNEGDLWRVDLVTGDTLQLTQLGIPSLSKLAVGRYSRREREIGPGIWSGPTYAWSPDSQTIALHVVDRRDMRQVPFPNYLADETEPNWVRRGYPGDANEKREVFLLDVQSTALRQISLPEPTARQVLSFSWSSKGTLLIDTATDTAVERRILTVTPDATTPVEVWLSQRPSRMYTNFSAAWHPDGERIIFLSDREDRYGLYSLNASPSKQSPRRLSDPAFDALSGPAVATATDWIYFTGNGEGPSEQHVYRLNPSEGISHRLTSMSGQNVGYPSPDGEHLVVRHSSDTSPPDLYVIGGDKTDATRVTTSPLPAFQAQQWASARYVTFPSGIDDYTLHARILEPADLDPEKKYPVIFGPVYSNTVRNQWRGIYSLVQQYLVQRGFIVVQVDVRGSTGYGRDFREAFLLDFAGEDLDDLASAVAYMESLPFVDDDRIGIWGSSYGGTLSVYSMLRKPGLFEAAAAAASAVDPDFFGTDDVAIVRRPDTNPEIFERKALRYVDNLTGQLLLIHGMQDHVVPFKTTATLADALIRAGKDFDFAFAPGATHGWAREPHYQRYLFNKLVAFFERHLK